ncbi:MAG: cell division protein FtsA [Candidatus Moranbacteria bacterium]|nr:cell division protein FtsA [Candidatus Moranbacteria bacterium]
MIKQKYITVLDIGSSFVRVVVAEIISGEKPRVIGVGKTESFGMRKGVIIDLEDVVKSIKSSVEKAERMSGVQVEDVYVAVGGSHLKCISTKGVIGVSKADGEVTEDDVERVLDSSQAINIAHNYEILHVIPQNFSLDDQKGIREPVGMIGVRLEMRGVVIAGFIPYLRNIAKCINRANFSLNGFVAAPLAAAKAILNKRQKELGVVSVDIGGETTSLAIFEERELVYLAVLPVGANHITNDVAIGMRTAIDVAEKAKLKYGSAIPDEIDKKEKINLASLSSEEEGVISRHHVAEIIEARVEEIFQLVEKELKKINRSALLPAGVVLTGGGSCLYGMVDLAKENLKLPAQIGFPDGLSGLVDKIDDPSCSVMAGAVLWIMEEGHQSISSMPQS